MPNLVEIDIRAEDLTGPGFASVLGRVMALKEAIKSIGGIHFDSGGALDAELSTIKSKLQSHRIADLLDINMNSGAIDSQLLYMKRRIESHGIADLLDVNVDTSNLGNELNAAMSIVSGESMKIAVGLDTSEVQGDLSAIMKIVSGETMNMLVKPSLAEGSTSGISSGIASAVTSGVVTGLNDTRVAETAALDSLIKYQSSRALTGGLLAGAAASRPIVSSDVSKAVASGAAAGLAAGLGGRRGTPWAAATSAAIGGGGAAGFGGGGGGGSAAAGGAAGGAAGRGGGRFGWGLLGGTIGGIATWHVALDATAEALIAVSLAAVAAGAGIATMAPAVNELGDDLHSVYAVSGALHQSIPPLTGQFNNFVKSMAPQTVVMYGGALDILNRNAGALQQTGSSVVTMFEDWTIKINDWSKAQGGMGGLLSHGVGYLQQFGSVIGTIGKDIGELLKADPGVAHYLLDIMQGAAQLVGVLLKLPSPLVKVALGLHGMYIWGSVLAVPIRGLVSPIVSMANAVGLLSDKQAKAVKSSINFKNVLKFFVTNPYGWVADAAGAIAYLAYESTQADAATKAFVADLEAKLSGMNAGQAIIAIASDVGTLNDQISKVQSAKMLPGWNSISNTFQRVGASANIAGNDFAKSGDSFAKSFQGGQSIGGFLSDLGHGFADAAKGVNAWVTDAGGATANVGNDVNYYRGAIIKLTGSQAALFGEVGKLMNGTSKWDTSTVGVTGHVASLSDQVGLVTKGTHTYAQAIAIMDMAGIKWNDTAKTMDEKVQMLFKGYANLGQQSGILTNNVNAVTFALWQQDSNVGKVNQGWDAFYNTVTGGSSQFAQFAGLLNTVNGEIGKSGVSMNGLNSKSIALRNNFYQTSAAANTELDNLTSLVSASGLAAKGTNYLGRASKDLVATLLPAAKGSQQATTALYALAQRGGYHGADSFKALSEWVGKTQDPMRNLDGIVTTLTKKSGNLTKDVENLANALNIQLNTAMAAAIMQAHGGQGAFDKFANSVKTSHGNIHDMLGPAGTLAQELITLTGNTKEARGEFITFAEKLNLSKQKAEDLWNQLQELGKVHANPSVTVHASGTGVLTAQGQGVRNKELIFKAAGGRVAGGWGGGDIQPAMLEPGEIVVDKYKSRMYAPLFQAMGIPGMAKGGMVGGLNAPIPWTSNAESDWTKSLANTWANSVVNQYQNYLNTLSSGAVGGDEAANAALARSMYHLSPSSANWIAWNFVAMRESGWNRFAVNPGSGAYGIPQALPPTKMPFAAQAAGGSHAGPQIQWMWNYMNSSWGGPIGAALHEAAYHWYGNGLQGGVFKKPTLIGVGDKPERVDITPLGKGHGPGCLCVNCCKPVKVCLEICVPKGASSIERELINMILKYVRLQGGGDVQVALGTG